MRLLVDSVARKFDFNDGQADVSLEIGFKAEAISFYKRLLRCSTNLTVGSRLPKKTSEVDEKSREYAFIWLNLWYVFKILKINYVSIVFIKLHFLKFQSWREFPVRNFILLLKFEKIAFTNL